MSVDEAEIKRRLSFADAALGAAGHEVTDPTLLQLGRLVADGTLTAEEANARGLAHLDVALFEAEIERRMDFADAALGAAGHEVSDPELRDLRRRAIRGDISTDEAIAAGLRHIDNR